MSIIDSGANSPKRPGWSRTMLGGVVVAVAHDAVDLGAGQSNQTPGVEASDRIAVRMPAASMSASAPRTDQPTCEAKCGMPRLSS